MDKKTLFAGIAQLRQKTRAGIVECSNALQQTNGNIDEAIKILYERAQIRAEKIKAKKRELKQKAAFGGVNAAQDRGVIIQLCCETDFVSRDSHFVELAEKIVEVALETQPETIDALMEQKISQEESVAMKINFWISTFGEEIVINGYETMHAKHVTCFVAKSRKGGCLLASQEPPKDAAGSEALKTVGLHILLEKPLAITPEAVVDVLQAGGKQIPNVEKIAEKKALLNQPLYKDETKSVAEYIASVDPSLTLERFIRVS